MRRLSVLAAGAVLLLVGGLAAAGFAEGGDAGRAPAAGPSRTARAAEIEISVTPMRVDASAAVFEVVFDTHSTDLDFDPTEVVTLDGAGGAVRPATWDGDGPGGHHREGELRFDTGVRLDEVVLRFDLGESAVLTWKDDGS